MLLEATTSKKSSKMTSNIFQSYNKADYLEWHNREVEGGKDFECIVENMREGLKRDSASKLNTLGQLLSQIKLHTEPECKLQSNGLLVGEFVLPIKDFSQDSSPDGYDALFKSVDSIIEKCWRKNATLQDEYVGSKNISNAITDLVRTSVVCPTLRHAKMFSERFEVWSDFIPEEDADKYFSSIRVVEVDREAKPASGYFAYHSLVHFFDDDVPIEVQFYSQLSSAWRGMSHKLYESARVGESPALTPESAPSRLISLGHMLHLAECELGRLVDELKDEI